ncbi:collagenase [Lysobacter sp. 22409]|uniref:collagenase n=1 Tax=Lysobacter sp. 22409 TaxID=3453917 RepID=UPI003F83F32A
MSFAPKPGPTQALMLGAVVTAVSFLSYALPWDALSGASAESGPLQSSSIQSDSVQSDSVQSGSARSPLQTSGFAVGHGAMAAQTAAARVAAVRKSPATERQIFDAHQQDRAAEPSLRIPYQPLLRERADTDYDGADARRDILQRPSLAKFSARSLQAAEAACDPNQFASLSGAALVAAVKSADTDCINQLFGLSGTTAYGTFREAQMVTIANALATSARDYNGTNAGSTLQLVLFLRAGYYVQFYDTSVGSYGAPLKNAIRPALDAFAANANFGLVNDVHGETLAEFVTLIDSSIENARYLYVVKRLLDSYNSSYNAYYWMKVAVNNAYNVTFRGHQDEAFRTAVQADPSIVDTLYNFANTHFAMLGQADDYLVANAGREIGRFLQYTGNVKSIAQSRAKTLLDRSSVTGPTARLWVGIGEMVDYFDKANCGYYGLCDFKARVDAAALPVRHTCSPTLRLRAQAMTAAQLADTCAIVAGEETYFHQTMATGGVPVANDQNAALEMVVFDSSTDYGIYAGALYGINTNNGGMYLEGNPAATGNQARFIAYEAEWMRPQTFEIWNLTHEYIHYLDGRFNMFGDFNAAMKQKTVWWVEGFAEYMSFSYRNLANTAAQSEAARGTYALSRVYQNDYNSGQNLVYRWGYLAVRFMFEQRRSEVNSILGYFRPGNYTGYATFMGGIGSNNDAAFRAWLPCVATPDAPGCGGTPNKPPVAGFGHAANGLTVNFSDSSSDPDGSIASRQWSFGDGTSSTATNPSKTYATAGTYTVRLTVTDNRGATATTSKSVTVTGGTSNTPPVAAFTTRIEGLKVSFTDGSSDADGSIASRSWNFGDGTSSTATNPVKTYAAAGTYAVQLTVTDNRGARTTLAKSVTVSSGGGLPECSAADTRELGKNCSRSNLAASAGGYVYMFLNVPAGTTQLRITTSGGTGNADLYVNTLGSWATRSAHNYRSTASGNTETLTVNNPPVGYVFVSLYGTTDFSGVRVSVQY